MKGGIPPFPPGLVWVKTQSSRPRPVSLQGLDLGAGDLRRAQGYHIPASAALGYGRVEEALHQDQVLFPLGPVNEKRGVQPAFSRKVERLLVLVGRSAHIPPGQVPKLAPAVPLRKDDIASNPLEDDLGLSDHLRGMPPALELGLNVLGVEAEAEFPDRLRVQPPVHQVGLRLRPLVAVQDLLAQLEGVQKDRPLGLLALGLGRLLRRPIPLREGDHGGFIELPGRLGEVLAGAVRAFSAEDVVHQVRLIAALVQTIALQAGPVLVDEGFPLAALRTLAQVGIAFVRRLQVPQDGGPVEDGVHVPHQVYSTAFCHSFFPSLNQVTPAATRAANWPCTLRSRSR